MIRIAQQRAPRVADIGSDVLLRPGDEGDEMSQRGREMTVDKGPQVESRQALLPLVVRHDVGGRLLRRRVGEGLLVCEQTCHLDRSIEIAERDGGRRRPGGRKRVCPSCRREEQNDERDRGSGRDRADTDSASPGSMNRRLPRHAWRRGPLAERRARLCAPRSRRGSLRPRAAGARRKSREPVNSSPSPGSTRLPVRHPPRRDPTNTAGANVPCSSGNISLLRNAGFPALGAEAGGSRRRSGAVHGAGAPPSRPAGAGSVARAFGASAAFGWGRAFPHPTSARSRDRAYRRATVPLPLQKRPLRAEKLAVPQNQIPCSLDRAVAPVRPSGAARAADAAPTALRPRSLCRRRIWRFRTKAEFTMR